MLVVEVDFGEAVFCGCCQTEGIGGTEVGNEWGELCDERGGGWILRDNISFLFQRGAIITEPKPKEATFR